MAEAFAIEPHDPVALQRFAELARYHWGLPPRQAEMLYHACRGLTARTETGAAMGIGERAIRDYRRRTFARLGVAEITGAVVAVWPIFRKVQ